MKTLLKLAIGMVVARALVKLLARRDPARRTNVREPWPSAEGPIASMPVETLNDSAGTPLSATRL